MHDVISWLYATRASQFIQNTDWIIPTVQSIHILAIAILFGSALVMNLRLAGAMATSAGTDAVLRRYTPWLWGGLGVLVASGLLMVVGEPERVLANWVFWTKMALLVAGVLLWIAIEAMVRRQAGKAIPPYLRVLGVVALLIWVGVIFCGRWIAYVM